MSETTRREFLKKGARGLVGGAAAYFSVPLVLPRLVSVSAEGVPTEHEGTLHHWGFVVDTTKCIGCGRCIVACKQENNVPPEPEYFRTWVERYAVTEEGKILVDSPEGGTHGFADLPLEKKYPGQEIRDTFFVPKLCNQCEKPPCVQVCPVGATYQTQDGVVLIDRKHCVGCRYCIQACPYGARFFDYRYGIVDKCTWCYHRIDKGLLPACVEVCPVGARIFGDLRDPASPVRTILRDTRVSVLKPDLGTRPQVNYIGLSEGVR